MNCKQRVVLLVGAAMIALMGIRPPWVLSSGGYYRAGPVRDCGYNWIWSPTDSKEEGGTGLYPFAANIDMSRLCVQWVVAAVVTGSLIAAFADKKDKKVKEERKE